MSQRLASELGIAVGISSGANLLGALEIAHRQGAGACVATVFCDDNKKYLSTDLCSDEECKEHYSCNQVELLASRSCRPCLHPRPRTFVELSRARPYCPAPNCAGKRDSWTRRIAAAWRVAARPGIARIRRRPARRRPRRSRRHGPPHQLIGKVESASQGTVTRAQLETRPVMRTGELLETVPGLVVTQHAGDGKANQYFLRGFNLDHGTDLATSVDGIPVNMHTHGHGQGYTDINFVIPELLDRIEYKKGTYYADEGNFSAAGALDCAIARAR